MARFSPAAQYVRGALVAYLKPRLAMDSQPHCTAMIDRAVSGLTSRNFNQRQEPIRRALQRYTQGRLAQDNGINDLAALLGALAPEASQADQAPGMGQINTNPGGSAGPMSVTPSPDQGGGPPGMGGGGGAPGGPPGAGGGGSPIDLIVKYLTEEGVAPEIINNIPAIVSQGGGGGGDSGMAGMQQPGMMGGMDAIVPRTQPGMDQEEIEGEPGSGAMRVMEPRGGSESDFRPESASDEMPGHDPRPWEKAEDEDAAEDELVPGEQDEQMGGVSAVSSEGKSSRVVNGGANDSRPVTRSAMDHAIRVAQDAAIRNQRAIRDAERFVRPWVGDIAMDSAVHPADIYRGALKALGVKGADRLHPDALRPILEAQPKAGARMQQQRQFNGRPMAADSNANVSGSFADRFPDAALITVMQ
jgi:hypothetical protein